MHPTMERLFMFTVLTGQITDMTWPNNDATSTSEKLSNYGDTCVGHGGSDVFPFGILDTDVDGFEVRQHRERRKGGREERCAVEAPPLEEFSPLLLASEARFLAFLCVCPPCKCSLGF